MRPLFALKDNGKENREKGKRRKYNLLVRLSSIILHDTWRRLVLRPQFLVALTEPLAQCIRKGCHYELLKRNCKVAYYENEKKNLIENENEVILALRIVCREDIA